MPLDPREIGRRARAGQINTGNFQQAFGTGLTPGITDSVTGNKNTADVQTNIGTSLTEVGSESDLLQAQNPFLTQEQSNILKRRRGLAAAGGLFGSVVDAAQQRGENRFLASNRVAALGTLQAQSADVFNSLSQNTSQAFNTLGDLTKAYSLGFNAEEFRPIFQTLNDLGFRDEVNTLLADRAGQLAQTSGGNINQEVFGALQQFVVPQLSPQARSIIAEESRRLPARFINPGETRQGVFEQRQAIREGNLLAPAVGQSRVRAGAALSGIIGQKLAEFRNSAENLQLQHSLARGALARGDFQSVLSADFSGATSLFQGLGIQAGPARAAKRTVNQGQIEAATLAARERFTPKLQRRPRRTLRTL